MKLVVNKYHNKKTVIDGIKFDSEKEGNYYLKLKMLEKAGKIRDLKIHVPFLLLNTIKYKNKTYSKVQYYADFQYLDVETGKIKMLLNKYPNIDFEEII